MSYIVFARKYRPQDFDEVIGQEFITTTLKNAIKQDRIAHAYLFAGPRGVGKTSTARIFAKALNCEKGPTVKPCQKCTSCTEISSGISMDVIEIDGASNRGIDEIRNLRENVKFGAVHGKFKVYIIDEVHMLTQEAFNALLKTLEEPPPHVKFIFATTQPHKVLSTIVSRCQRFDFKRISVNEMISKLKEIAKAEGLDASEEALFHIARAAASSMRDAETILDQLSSFCKGKIKKEDVSEALGSIEEEKIFSVIESILNRDAKSMLLLVDKLVNEGKDLFQFTSNLIDHARNLLVARVSKDPLQLIELPEQSVEAIVKQSRHFTAEEILYIIYLLINTSDSMKRSESARIPLEAALIKLTGRASITPLNEIIAKVSDLEKRFSNSGTESPAPEKKITKTAAAPVPRETTPEKTEPATTKPPAPEPETQRPPVTDMDQKNIEQAWLGLIKAIRDKKMSVASFLLEGKVHSVEGGVFTIGFPSNFTFHKESLERRENKTLLEECLKEILKKDVRVKIITYSEPRESKFAATDETEADKPHERVSEPIIHSAIEIFKGRLVKDRTPRQPKLR